MNTQQPVSKKLRPAAVAGQFYPGTAEELGRQVDALLNEARGQIDPGIANDESPEALIVPHAGYRYSGAIAASAYARLGGAVKQISRVVLIGPAHRVRLKGVAFSGADYFDTPLGRVPLDVDTVKQCVRQFPFASIGNKAHQHEHSLETQLPFLQRCLSRFKLVPMVVGAADPLEIAQLLSYLWGNRESVVIVSSDLSHYKPYKQAKQIDTFTSQAITALNPDPITYEHACGQVGIRGLLHVARQRKLVAAKIDVRNSGDTADRKDQVVGYGSFGFYSAGQRLNRRQRSELGRVAWSTIDHGLNSGEMLVPSLKGYGSPFTDAGATFVTLTAADGRLRGCIGSLTSDMPLLQNVSRNAFKAAFADGRFQPLTAPESTSVGLEVSVLGPWERVPGENEEEIVSQIRPFIDGLIFVEGERRGTFLPSVWKSINDPTTFFRQLKKKGGFAEDYWSDQVKVYRYHTETWSAGTRSGADMSPL